MMRKFLVAAAFSGAAFVLPSAAALAGDWAAVASDGHGTFGYAIAFPGQSQAVTAAMGKCGPACKVELSDKASCLAYAESRQGGYWYGVSLGATQHRVIANALGACAGGAPAGSCHVLKVECR